MSSNRDTVLPLDSYGIIYTPESYHSVPKITIEDLKANGTHTVRVTWLDLSNTPCYRSLSIEYFSRLIEKSRPGINILKGVLGIVGGKLANGFGVIEEYLYAFDMSTLRLCSYASGHASVMGWFEEKSPPPGTGLKVPLCPRTVLQRVVEDARIEGTTFLVGFEIEFTLLKSTNPLVPVNKHGMSVSKALLSGTVETKVLDEIAIALRASGIELQMYHAEVAPGQYEIVTGPLPPLQAVDALVHTREVIYNIASLHNLVATLAPRISPESFGTGAHTHISVHPSPPTPGLPANSASFLSAVLTHLPSLVALTLPIPASYSRMVDGVASGGTYVCWGTEAREAPLRLCNSSSPTTRNFELKTMDGTANPYLALAGVLGVGMRGIKEQRKLEVKDCVTGSKLGVAFAMTDEERSALGITQRLPLTWEAAREAFRKDEVVRDVLGQEVVEAYLNVNELLRNSLQVHENESELDAFVRLIEMF